MGGPAAYAAERVQRDFVTALPESPPALDVLEVAARALLRSVPADIWCTVLLDPSTLLDTGGQHAYGFPDSVLPRLFEIEHIEQEGVDNLRRLAARRTTASVLSDSARDELDSSVYYRDILRPQGFSDELRVLLRAGNQVWGLLVMCRSGGNGFSTRDLAVARALTKPASQALRGSLLLTGIDEGQVADAAGMLVLDEAHRVVSTNPTAERWLADLQDDPPGPDRLPNAVRALATRARSASVHGQVRSLARTRSARWATLEGFALSGSDGPRTAVAIRPADPTHLTPIILDTYGLSPREREVMQCVLLGFKPASIARRLKVTTDTVHKHIQSACRKAETDNREDFTSNLFFTRYLPKLAAPPLTTDGRLMDE